jgi:hypothetical protein
LCARHASAIGHRGNCHPERMAAVPMVSIIDAAELQVETV